MRVVNSDDSNAPHPNPDVHTSEVRGNEAEDEDVVMVHVEDDIVEVPMDEDLDAKKTFVVPFDPRDFKRK